jgi:hypothetical protein
MKVYRFRLTAAPISYRRMVQCLAVVSPICRQAFNPLRLCNDVAKVQRIWRGRLSSLRGQGWPLKDEQRTFCTNCCPVVVTAKPATRGCKHRRICPFCYARQVGDWWARVDHAFTLHPYTDLAEQYSLCRLKFPNAEEVSEYSAECGFTDMGEAEERTRNYYLNQFLVGIPRRRKQFHSEVSTVSALQLLTMEPRKYGWFAKHRRLLQVDPNVELPLPPARDDIVRRQRRIKAPTRKERCHALARVCCYPLGLLFGDPRETVRILENGYPTRPALRLSSVSGAMRSIPPTTEEPTDDSDFDFDSDLAANL